MPRKKKTGVQLPVMGRPRKFKTEEDFINAFKTYIEHCSQVQDLPNIKGFSVYNDMTSDTFYSQREYFPDTYRKVRDALEDRLQNYHHYQPAATMAVLQGKNTFGWDDRPGDKTSDGSLDIDSLDLDEQDLDRLLLKLGYLGVPEE
jgi:hypothetical protein